MDPIALAKEIEGNYRRYLNTTFYFRDPALRTSFAKELSSGHLSKGPFVEATPVFRRTQQPGTLFQQLLGSPAHPALVKALQEDRTLYQHQEDAIRKVDEGGNVIVATGTGSGKTEAFLYPVLLHLYREFQAATLCPGVRALILYPMNALANDQRERLGELFKLLDDANAPFRFTFGQYIGETPDDVDDSQRHAADHIVHRKTGELVLRSEMRCTPPHILLTNYSMLEYMLLRPDDSPLFDKGRARWWTFLILDEAHQYRGSRGIEMAMLLRRVKRRLRSGGRSAPFKCIATSATLVGGTGDKAAVARFASDLFGEQFPEDNVILGETEAIPQAGDATLGPDAYAFLADIYAGQASDPARSLAELEHKLSMSEGMGAPSERVARILQRDGRTARLRQLLTQDPLEVGAIASQVFCDVPDASRISALSGLISLLAQVHDPASKAPLLAARYHLFLRSLEGAFVSYHPGKRVCLERKTMDEDSVAFEVALCRECGQHYFVGPKNFMPGRLGEAVRDPADLNFGATFVRPLENESDGEEGEDGKPIGRGQIFELCVRCGGIARTGPPCGHNTVLKVIREEPPKDEDRADQIAKCGACGYSAAGRDPARELIHGADGPNAVIATTLYRALPEGRRKVLAFADGRQEAAFFAWYLENSYKDILRRNLLLRVARQLYPHTSEGLSLRELAIGLRSVFRERAVFPAALGDLELRREAWLAIYRELLTDEPRISLEGVGLVRWAIKWPDWLRIPEVFLTAPWSLAEGEARELVSWLLDSLRGDRAVELGAENSVSLNWSDLDLQPAQLRVRIGQPKGQKGVRSWDGTGGKRARFLAKLLMRMRNELSEQIAMTGALEALRAVWETVRQCDASAPSTHDRLLIAIDDARRLNPGWWRLHLLGVGDTIFQCDICGRLQTVSLRGVCPRHRCGGTLREATIKTLEANHYRLLYEEDLPGSLRAEEHTAQLDKERAREFQREFRNGRIHVLSSSTTFELGVDLGDLDTIFLRNVPPEAFNYAQRVGRAGRRTGYPGFAITYCRRSPHDLTHFAEPLRMLSGRVRPPALSLHNEKILTRHVAAMALSLFFRTFGGRYKTVGALFQDLEHPSAVADFQAFSQSHRQRLEEELIAIVPSSMVSQMGLTDGTWILKVTGEESRLSLAEAEVACDYRAVKGLEVGAASRGDYDTAKWAKARARTIAEEDVPSFLSRKAIIPKYGFPVDVVELDTQRTQRSHESMAVSLQRDLTIAVAEFAPTSKLIANKKVWTSYGLKKVAEKEWHRWWYARCATHARFERAAYQKEEHPPAFEKCCDRMVAHQYVEPRFGFITGRDRPEEPQGRPARVFTTRPYFAGFKGSQPDDIDLRIMRVAAVSPGFMVVLCEGRRGEGFYLCGACGAGFRTRRKAHDTPQGEECRGTLEQASLGHEFVTDVLKLQFRPAPEVGPGPVWFAYALAYAIVEGAAETLEVPSTDLSATVAYGSQQECVSPIIIYDNVPGGAGLVARLQEKQVLRECLEAARKRVLGHCGCAEDTSCYGCLRNYRNQFAHQHLHRGPAKRYLEAILSGWK